MSGLTLALLLSISMIPQAFADALFVNMNASPSEGAAFNAAMREREKEDPGYQSVSTPPNGLRELAYKVGVPGSEISDLLEDPAFNALASEMAQDPSFERTYAKAVNDSIKAQGASGSANSNEVANAYAMIMAFRAVAQSRSSDPALVAKINRFLNEHADFDRTYNAFIEAKRTYMQANPPSALQQIQDSLDQFKTSGRTLDTIVLSGHSSGDNLFSNLQEGVLHCDWLALSSKYPAQFAQVKEVTLMGCYMGSPDARKFWHQIFPNAEIIDGYNSKAPPESAQTGDYLKEMLRTNDQALRAESQRQSTGSIDRQLVQSLDRVSHMLGPQRDPVIDSCRGGVLVPTSQKYTQCDPAKILGGIPGNTVKTFAEFKAELDRFSQGYFPNSVDPSTSSDLTGHLVDPELLYKQVQAFLGSEDVCLPELSQNEIPMSEPDNYVKTYLNTIKAQAFVMRSWPNFRQGYLSYFGKELSDLRAVMNKHPAECARFKDAYDVSLDWRKFYATALTWNSPASNSCVQAILGIKAPQGVVMGAIANPGSDADKLQKGVTALEYISNLGGAFEHSSWLNGTETDQSWRQEAAHMHISEAAAWGKITNGSVPAIGGLLTETPSCPGQAR